MIGPRIGFPILGVQSYSGGFQHDRAEPAPDIAEVLGPAMTARFPRVTELAMSVSHDGVLGRCDDDVEFAFGLDLILDGLEQRASQTAPTGEGPRSQR